jgi:restriction system protein
MKFAMAKNSLFAVLLRSPWWISLGLAGVIVLLSLALLPAAYVVVGAVGSLPFWVIGALAFWRQLKLPSASQVTRTTEAVSAMPWPQFSALLEQAFQRDGFTVKRPDGPGSGAYDFVLERKGRTMLVAARRWKSARIGLDVLRALQQAREQQEAPDALLICLGGLTDTAVPFAAQHRIAVWQSAELAQALGKLPLQRRDGL